LRSSRGANTLDVTEGVEAALDELRPGLTDIEIDASIFRPATFIEQAVSNLAVALLLGCLLVILIIGAFLFEWRTAVISVAAIPISLVAASLVLCREHPAAVAAEPTPGGEEADRPGDPGGLARGPRRDPLRDHHHPGRGRAGILHRLPCPARSSDR
jgi:hypothetical protein